MGAGNLDGQSCFLHRFYLYGWQDNTNLHEILTDIAAKRKPRRGDFENGVLNSYFLKENNKESETYGNLYDMWNIDHSDRDSITEIQKAFQR